MNRHIEMDEDLHCLAECIRTSYERILLSTMMIGGQNARSSDSDAMRRRLALADVSVELFVCIFGRTRSTR